MFGGEASSPNYLGFLVKLIHFWIVYEQIPRNLY